MVTFTLTLTLKKFKLCNWFIFKITLNVTLKVMEKIRLKVTFKVTLNLTVRVMRHIICNDVSIAYKIL